MTHTTGKCRPEEVMTQLTRLHSAMVAAGVWGAIIRQFFVDVYQAIDARLFNAIIERSDLCTSANGTTRFLPLLPRFLLFRLIFYPLVSFPHHPFFL